jgi:undecaprenyl diphosphate synthase
VRTTVETCAQLGVGALTLYAFSVENWKRPRLEVDTLWRLLRVYLRSELALMMRHDIRFAAIGRLEELPAQVRADLEDVTRKTSGNRGLRLNLAINYGGRAELVDAVKALVNSDVEVTEQAISDRLYTAGQPDPDLLIRTSGEMRISNFLLWPNCCGRSSSTRSATDDTAAWAALKQPSWNLSAPRRNDAHPYRAGSDSAGGVGSPGRSAVVTARDHGTCRLDRLP